MSEILERMQERARELARSGKFLGYRSVAFELQFEPRLKEAFQWLHSASVEDAFQWLTVPQLRKSSTAFAMRPGACRSATTPKPLSEFRRDAPRGARTSPA